MYKTSKGSTFHNYTVFRTDHKMSSVVTKTNKQTNEWNKTKQNNHGVGEAYLKQIELINVLIDYGNFLICIDYCKKLINV